MKKILLVGSQHGDELLGEYLHEYISAKHPDMLEYTDYIVANLQAKEEGTRFIESDMNRSYVAMPRTHEEKQAAALLTLIEAGEYSLVLDMHTTTCQQPICIITKDITTQQQPFIDATSISHIVLMQQPIVEQSLIGKVPYALSIEAPKQDIDDTMLESLCQDILRYYEGVSVKTMHEQYEVIGLLEKTELSKAEASSLVNFQQSAHGYYPVLVGEATYKKNTNYLGFKTRKLEQSI